MADISSEIEDYSEDPKYDVYPKDLEEILQEETVLLSALDVKKVKWNPPLQFKGRTIKLLVDSGSTCNLISQKLSNEIGLQEKQQEYVHIILPTGEILKCVKGYDGFYWKLNELNFKADVIIADLSGWDIILGIPWLAQLGEFTCNLMTQTLQFWREEELVQLSADSYLHLEGSCHQITTIVPTWKEQILDSYTSDSEVKDLIPVVAVDKSGPQ